MKSTVRLMCGGDREWIMQTMLHLDGIAGVERIRDISYENSVYDVEAKCDMDSWDRYALMSRIRERCLYISEFQIENFGMAGRRYTVCKGEE